MKKLVIDCDSVIYPFGSGMPICLEGVERTMNTKDLKPCVMQQCPRFKKKVQSDEKKRTLID